MIGGLYKTTSRMAIAAAAGLYMGGMALAPAQAADLGGDCCADLEERVAELEATTARKGTRKTSLTVYGWVNRALLYFDDGIQSDVYSVDNSQAYSRLGVKGSANAMPGLTVGYHLQMSIESANMSNTGGGAGVSNIGAGGGLAGVGGDNADDGSTSVTAQLAFVYLKGAWGKVTLGKAAQPMAGITEVDLSGTKVVATARGIRWNNNFVVASGGVYDVGGLTWGNLALLRGHLGGTRRDLIRYDTPKIAGFVASVAWGEDDFIDGALRWAGTLGDFKIAAGIGYRGHNGTQTVVDAGGTAYLAGDAEDGNRSVLAGSFGVIHSPTGLNIHVAAGEQTDVVAAGLNDSANFWYIKGGIKQNFFGIGDTAFYGEYHQTNDRRCIGVAVTNNCSSEYNFWGLGVVQHLPNAASELYLGYRNYSATETGVAGVGVTTNYDDLDMVLGGMRIKF